MSWFGLLAGLMTLLIIGLGFPLVILGERRFGLYWWPYMLGLGLLLVFISFFISSDWLAVFTGVLGATFAWGATELKEQAVRTELGWYPFNPHKIHPPFEAVIKKLKAPHL